VEPSIDMVQRVISKNIFLQDEFIPPEGTEFVCVINKQGRIEQSLYKNGLNVSKEKEEMLTMGVQLQNSMQSDFDAEFGRVRYTITERENARFISIPTHVGILLVKLDKSTDPFAFVNEIAKIMNPSKVLLESSGVC
jgi:hypothetical protein